MGDRLRADRLRAVDVLLDDRPQDRGLALVELGHCSPVPSVASTRSAGTLPVGTRCYRVPTAAREQEPGGHVGRERAGRERVSTTRSSTRSQRTRPPRARRRPSRPPRRRPARRGGCAARARTPPRPGRRRRARSPPASADVPAVDRGDVALGRAHVPPAPAVGVAVRRAADAEVLALAPVQQVVPALLAGPRPVRDLVPLEPGGAEQRRRRARYASAWWSSSGAARAGRDAAGRAASRARR